MSDTSTSTPVDALASSLVLPRGRVLRNRIMRSALSEGLSDRSHGPSPRLVRLYERWGAGGYGLIVTGNVMVDRRHLGEPGNVVVEDDRHLAELAQWAAAARSGGAAVWAQINHPGRQANALAGRSRPVAPSAVAAHIPGAVRPRALEEAEIWDLVDRYATAAAVMERAGFDGVQLHGAHGYLITQFLSPLVNRRTDDWGGDPERRRRFLLEILRAIRFQVREEFSVGIKLNSADFQRGGFDEEESREVVRMLVAEGIDLIEVSGGTYESPAMMGTVRPSTLEREAYFLEYARTVQEITGSVPVAVTGGFRSAEAMGAALAAGDCNLVGVGRGPVTTPDAAARLLDGAPRVDVRQVRLGARALLGRVTDLRTLDGALDLQWHTDQMHRMAAGMDPDPGRAWWRTVGTAVHRNGIDAFRRRRG